MRHWAHHLSPSPIHTLHHFLSSPLCTSIISPLPSLNNLSKQSLPIHAFILTFHCVQFPISFQPFRSSLCPIVISFISLSSLSSSTSDQRAAVCPENDQNDGYIWLLERDRLLEKLLCQSDRHISQQVEKTEVKQIKRI